MNDNYISLPKNRRRIVSKSFLSNETSVEDNHGHGTHTAALLLKVAANADIFVARIAKTDDSDDSIDPKSVENVSLLSSELDIPPRTDIPSITTLRCLFNLEYAD
jgi:hypothetical protein